MSRFRLNALPLCACIRSVFWTALIVFLVSGWPQTVRAEQFVGLGDGLSLSYQSGSLDPATLAGSAENVKLLVGDEPVASIGRLRLETRGALVDRDFTILSIEAFDIVAPDGKGSVEEVNGRDIPVGNLRALAMEIDRRGDELPPAELFGLMRQVSLGALTLRGVKFRDGSAQASVRRAGIRNVGEGRIELIEVDTVAVQDSAENIQASLQSGQVTDFSLDPRFYPGLRFDKLSILSDEIQAALSSLEVVQQVATLKDGTTYPERQTLNLKDLTVQPGPKPDPDFKEMFDKMGEPGLRLQVESVSTMAPEGAAFAVDSALEARLQTGDTLNLGVGLQLPIASWQFLSSAIQNDPIAATSPEMSMQILLNMSLAAAELSVTTGKLAEAAVVAIAREESMTPEELRQKAADDATGAMLALPPSTKPYRDAIESFILHSGTLRLSLAPAFPLPLNAFMAVESQPDVLLEKLNVSVTHEPPAQ